MASSASISSPSDDHAHDPDTGARTPVAASEAVAVIQRDDFLLELGEALGGQISMRPVETLEAALEHLSDTRRVRILLLDSRDAPELRADVERVHAVAPQLPIVVFAPTESEQTVAGTLKSSNVFAVLPIPVDPRKTSAVLGGALAEATANRTASQQTAEPPAAPASLSARPTIESPRGQTAAPVSGADEPPPRGKRRAMLAIAAIAVVAAAGAAWYAVGRRTPSSAPPHAATTHTVNRAPSGARPAQKLAAASQAPLVAGSVDHLLEQARLAMRQRHFLPPTPDNALAYYLSVLKIEPTDGEAQDGLNGLIGLAQSRFNAAMTTGQYTAAATALAALKLASPTDARLQALGARLVHAEITSALGANHFKRAATLVQQAAQSHDASTGQLAAWRAELASDQSAARVAHLARRLTASIQAGHLRSPSQTSAQSDLEQLETLAPGSPAAHRGERELTAAYLSRARTAALAGEAAAADKWVTAARGAGMTPAQLAAYQQSVATGRKAAAAQKTVRLKQLARARIQSGELIAPAHDSAEYYLTQLKAAQGASKAVRTIGLELASSLIVRATTAARAGHIGPMRADLAAARRWGADPVLIAAVEQIVSGPAHSPTASTSAAPRIPAGYRPRRIRYVAPHYPQGALEAHESGSVTVQFTVDFDGKPRHVHVVKSHPRGVFDYAAVSAVSRWRFAPPVINNVPTEIPTRTVIRFVAPQ